MGALPGDLEIFGETLFIFSSGIWGEGPFIFRELGIKEIKIGGWGEM